MEKICCLGPGADTAAVCIDFMQYCISESLLVKYTTSKLLEYTQTLMQTWSEKMVTKQLPTAYSKRMLTRTYERTYLQLETMNWKYLQETHPDPGEPISVTT
jgi:hypothetical protein